ncbi:DUF397 domain-containing protein [Streptosporangium saharense]|uniref:DUF397 domain-containing protein n=1 Tax=Streptosporangium saharense TaxID=1706840 RepID=UPI003684AB17
MTDMLSGAEFRKSSLSGPNTDDCVEVATNLPDLVAVRDSKNLTGPTLTFTLTQWRSFITHIQTDTFDA